MVPRRIGNEIKNSSDLRTIVRYPLTDRTTGERLSSTAQKNKRMSLSHDYNGKAPRSYFKVSTLWKKLLYAFVCPDNSLLWKPLVMKILHFISNHSLCDA